MAVEKIDPARCNNCNKCVRYCPMDVFRENKERGVPDVAFREDCQSCVICEIYCPKDAIYVSPDRGRPSPLPW